MTGFSSSVKTAIKNVINAIREYCEISSLAGVPYIVNSKYHLTERIFWFICVSVSVYGAYHLIQGYQNSFESNAISLVIESVRPQDKIIFPSIAVCEIGFARAEYNELIDIVENLRPSKDVEYNNDVEDYLLRIIFQNIYSFGSLKPYCEPYTDCTDCMKCPTGNYSIYSEKVRSVCEKLFIKCVWNGKPFDCCQYFLPIQTTMGKCFIVNSIQITNNKTKHWMNLDVNSASGEGGMELVLKDAAAIHVLNEEDIPHMTLRSLQFLLTNEGYKATLKIKLQNIVNDVDVRDVDPLYRKCRFPDENKKNSTYKYYSFSTCASECLKEAQLKLCNCVNYNLNINENDSTPICDLNGFLCLDKTDLMYPQTTTMQPWRKDGLVCICQPSCNEHEIFFVEKTFEIEAGKEERRINIALQALPTERYRRQAVRAKLDVVVSVGGILGLFLGASILSGIELLYFFIMKFLKYLCGKF